MVTQPPTNSKRKGAVSDQRPRWLSRPAKRLVQLRGGSDATSVFRVDSCAKQPGARKACPGKRHPRPGTVINLSWREAKWRFSRRPVGPRGVLLEIGASVRKVPVKKRPVAPQRVPFAANVLVGVDHPVDRPIALIGTFAVYTLNMSSLTCAGSLEISLAAR